ncbi:MAG: DUF4252 domain-containing protein [Rhodothermales bacterium]|nr:DUF4252 domain-containing protein [Rhodothermales bacterium]MBO6778212.1 DUF4252 domain-containing protein [Rhodothermales bacterium]
MRRSFTHVILLLILAPTLAGCFYSREIAHIREDIEDILGARFEREVVVKVGPRLFRTVSWISGRVPDVYAQMASDYVREIDRVKVGVYSVEKQPTRSDLRFNRVPRFKRSGWEVAVRVEDDSETVWVLYRERYDSIRDMLVLVLNRDELVIARIEGHLNELVSMAVQDADFLRDVASWE